MTLIRFSALLGMALLAWVRPLSLPAQSSSVLEVTPPSKLSVKRGAAVEASLEVTLRGGYHVNSHTPAEEYLIPLRLTWQADPLQVAEVVYPKPEMRTYGFSSKPLSVFTGDFKIETRFKAPPTAPPGPMVALGRLRYQACNDKMCLPPRSVEVRLPIQIQ